MESTITRVVRLLNIRVPPVKAGSYAVEKLAGEVTAGLSKECCG
jgi:hypothetical protein